MRLNVLAPWGEGVSRYWRLDVDELFPVPFPLRSLLQICLQALQSGIDSQST